MKFLLTTEGRRAAALVLLAGAGAVMTVYAAVALWLVRFHHADVLTLGLSAHVIIFVCVTGFAGLLIKRMLKASVLGNNFESSDQPDAPAAAQTVADEAQHAADVIKGDAA